MPVTVRRLLSKLAALALTTSAVGPAAAAEPGDRSGRRTRGIADLDVELDLYSDDTIDREQLEPHDAGLALGRSLALALTELRPLEATQLVATWTLSGEPLRRLAVANALEWTFPLVGDAVVIDHLSRDPDPAIRAAAARAAWARRSNGGDAGVLDRLAEDPDPIVRTIASAAR